jgi:hypothetical protein
MYEHKWLINTCLTLDILETYKQLVHCLRYEKWIHSICVNTLKSVLLENGSYVMKLSHVYS